MQTYVSGVLTPTHKSVFGSCLLAPLYIYFFLMAQWVSVRESEVVHLHLWVLPVHFN